RPPSPGRARGGLRPLPEGQRVGRARSRPRRRADARGGGAAGGGTPPGRARAGRRPGLPRRGGRRMPDGGGPPADALNRIAACPIVSKNALAFARPLARSYRRHHPEARVFVLLVDRIDGYFAPSAEPFELVEIGELPIPDLPRFCFQYSV